MKTAFAKTGAESRDGGTILAIMPSERPAFPPASLSPPAAPMIRDHAADRTPLLGPADPPPVTVVRGSATAPMLLVCDHAGTAFPAALGTLGVGPQDLGRHIAYDIGAEAVTRHLSDRFDATAVLSGYSRLVIDLNRDLGDPTSIPEISDGTVVPGNRDLTPDAVARRVQALFWPYHRGIAAHLARLRRGALEGEAVPGVVSIHSFTPVMRGLPRPWHIGVLWDRDPRIAMPLIARLEREPGLLVGDNEPYSGRNTEGHTVDRHAAAAGLPHVLIEIRQDLIATADGQARWAAVLGDALADVLADSDLFGIANPG